MKFFRHLLTADIRRFLLLIVAWLFVVVAATIAEGVRPILEIDLRTRQIVGVVSNLLALAKLFLLLTTVPIIIQADALVGSTAFWMTRPIPPRALLAAKTALIVFLFIVVPTVADAVLMTVVGVPSPTVAGVVTQSALSQSVWVVLLMTGAALTPNLPRFALLCGAVVALVASALAVLTAIMFARIDDVPPAGRQAMTEDPTGGLIGAMLFIVACLTLIASQYAWRSRFRSVAIGAAGMVLAISISSNWPWPLLAPRLELPPWASGVSLNVDRDSLITEVRPGFMQQTLWSRTRADVTVQGLAPGWSAGVGMVDAKLLIEPNREISTAGGGGMSNLQISGQPEYATVAVTRQLLGVARLSDAVPQFKESLVMFMLRHADLTQYAPVTGDYRATFQVMLTHHEVEATLPLRSGERYQKGAYQFVIDRVNYVDGHVAMVARQVHASSTWDRRPWSQYRFFLRNRRLAEAVAGADQEMQSDPIFQRLIPFSSFSRASPMSGFRTSATAITFPASFREKDSEVVTITEDWVSDAELVIVKITRKASVDHVVYIPGFQLETSSKAGAVR